MLESLKQWLRVEWFIFSREYKAAVSTCWKCGAYGAHVCSLVYPKRLCNTCAAAVSRRAGLRESSKQ
jgi:hypothetical protein